MKTIILFILISFQIFPQGNKAWKLYAYYSGENYQTETIAFKSRVESNGGTISSATLKAVDDFVKDVSTIRTKLLRVNLICGSDTGAMKTPLFFNTDGSATPVGYTSDYLIGIVPADYTQATGLQCNTDPKLISTGINPGAIAILGLNDLHASLYVRGNVQSNVAAIGGGSNFVLYPRSTTNNMVYRVNSSSNVTGGASTDSRGFWVITRSRSDSSYSYRNGTQFSANASNSAAEVSAITIGGANTTTGTSVLVSGYTVGTGLTSSEQALLNTAIEKFNDALGRGVQ